MAARRTGFSGEHKRIVLKVLSSHPDGLTNEEISQKCDLDYLQVVRRVSDLQRDGAVIDTFEQRLNLSGRKAAVWRVM